MKIEPLFSSYDFINFLILIIFLTFFILYYKIKLFDCLFLYFHIFIFFLFHPFIVTESVYPDISYYLINIENLRENFLESSDQKRYQSIFYSLFPYIVKSYSSIGLMNLTTYFIIYFYLNHNKVFDIFTKLIFFVLPSLFLYSSISLKEMMVFLFFIISMHQLIIKNNFFNAFLLIIPMFVLRQPNLFIFYLTFSLFIFLFLLNYKYYKIAIFSVLTFIAIFILSSLFIKTSNYNFFNLRQILVVKKSLGIENNLKLNFEDISNFDLLFQLFLGFFKFYLFPFFNHLNGNLFSFKIYFIFENIFLKIIILYFFIISLKKYNYKHFSIDFFLILSGSLYGFVNINYFNMNRYSFSILLTYILLKRYLIRKVYEKTI